MAKISTYVIDGTIVDGDKVIGSDANNDMQTKNYTVGSLVSYFAASIGNDYLVPYIGANDNVDLGTFNLSAGTLSISENFIANGTVGLPGQALLSQGPGSPAIWGYVVGSQDLASVLNIGNFGSRNINLNTTNGYARIDVEKLYGEPAMYLYSDALDTYSNWAIDKLHLESIPYEADYTANKIRYVLGGNYVDIIPNSYNNQSFILPAVGGFMPVSVNGNFADASGNITVSTGSAQNLQQVTDVGNSTTNIINLYGGGNVTVWSNTVGGVLSSSLGEDGVIYALNEFRIGNQINNFVGSIIIDPITPITNDRTYTLPNASGVIPLTVNGQSANSSGAITIPVGQNGIPHATASGTDTYTATITGVTSYTDGDAYIIQFTNGNTTGCTLNINGLGAVTLYRNNDGALIGGDIASGGEMICVYDNTLPGFRVIGTTPNTLVSYVTNADSVAITKGQVVYAFGGQGDRLTVKLANNTSEATSAQTVGIVMSTSIGVNQKGFIITQGLLDGLSILPTSTFTDGDPLYLGATAGSITRVKPSAPNHLVYLGNVTTASPGAAGRWYVRVQNGYELQELHNVAISSVANNDGLFYESSTSLWKNKTIATVLGYTPFQLPSLTSGSVLFSNGTTIAQDNANFFWDDANNRLGIGTATPSFSLDISGTGRFTGLLAAQGDFYVGAAGSSQFDINTLSSTLPNTLGFWRKFGNGNYTYLKEDEQGGAQHKWAFVRRDGFNQTRPFFQANSSILNINLGWEDANSNNYDGNTLLINPKINITNAAITGTKIRGTYYNPTLTSLTNTTHIAYENTSGDIIHGNLAGVGSRMVTADATGKLGVQAIPAGTVTSVAALTLGTSGTDLTSTVANSTTTPVITLNVPTASSTNRGVLSSADWTTFNSKQGALTLTTTGTSGASTLVGNTLNIPQYGGAAVGGSTGNIQYNNGTTFAGSSNLFWDNTNTRFGIAQSTPTSRFHLNFNQNSETQDDANGILLANSTAAIVGTQSISPAIVWQGNGWQTGTGSSQDVRFRADVLPALSSTNPTGTWRLSANINNAGYSNFLQVNTIVSGGLVTSGNFYATSQFFTGQSGGNAPYKYRTTNAGADITPKSFMGNAGNLSAGQLNVIQDDTNSLVFSASNGTRHIARASINIASLTNTSGSESGDLIFLTQSGGTAMSEKMRIFGGGNVGIGTSTDAGFKLDVNGATRINSNISVSSQIKNGTSSSASYYRLTNGGAFATPQCYFGYTESNTVGLYGIAVDFVNNNGLVFTAPNGVVNTRLARAAVNITNLVNTAGSESGDMIFLTQSGGTAMSEKMRITGAGFVGINSTSPANTLDVIRGTAGTMGRGVYETASFSYNGDMKFGLYTSSSNSTHGAGLSFGQTNLVITANNYYPGFDHQYVYGSTPAANAMRYNYTERNSTGTVINYAANLMQVYGDGKIVFSPVASGVSTSVKMLLNTSTDDAVNTLQVNGSVKSTQFRLSALNTAPASATDTGTTGEIRIVNGAIYVCVATNTWQRALLTTF